ncbi:MAG: LPS export ABC transporter periplasmic protein LptC [Candidatus Eisenbacteria bacterium]|nr:LPS export ABC transporter periplasmic protein LptC [Candidatus Eisenbacteria bacterium]
MGNGKRLIAIVLALLLSTLRCGGGEEETVGETGTAPLPSQETKVRKWVEYRLGRMAWTFRGDTIRYYEEPERVEADGVIVDFYDEEERYASTLTADWGTIDRRTSDMESRGSVVIVNKDGVRLETDWVRWENKKERIYTDAFVTIFRGNQRITGYGMETDPGLEHTEIRRDVIARTVEEEDG